MLSFWTKMSVENGKKRKAYFSNLSQNILSLGSCSCYLLQLFSIKTQNCLFFVLLRCFLTLATLLGVTFFSYLSQ